MIKQPRLERQQRRLLRLEEVRLRLAPPAGGTAAQGDTLLALMLEIRGGNGQQMGQA